MVSWLNFSCQVGEPLNHEAWHWYNEVVGNKLLKITDTWWQTETGAICIGSCRIVTLFRIYYSWTKRNKYFSSCLEKKAPTPCLSGAIIKPAMPMRPFFGIDPVVVDEKVIHSSLHRALHHHYRNCQVYCLCWSKGIELPKTNSTGRLCIRRPWPSMARTINGDHKRFIDTYLKPYPGKPLAVSFKDKGLIRLV